MLAIFKIILQVTNTDLSEAANIISGISLSTRSLGSTSMVGRGVVRISDTDIAAMVAATWDEMDTMEENLCPILARLGFRSDPDLTDCCLSSKEAMSSFDFFLDS